MTKVRWRIAGYLLWGLSGWQVQAAPPLGEINIQLRGKVIAHSCDVVVSDRDKIVALGSWSGRTLAAAGSRTAPVAFSLRLTGCPAGQVSIIFAGDADPDNPQLLALNADSDARRVAVELRNANYSRLPLHQKSPLADIDDQGNGAFHFYANYIATADAPQPGQADADATFAIYYD